MWVRFLCYCLLIPSLLNGQKDSSYLLPSISVTALSLIEKQAGVRQFSFTIDSTPSLSLTDILQKEGLAYIRHYGMASLSTISINGSNTNQVAIMWHGIPIISPTLGLIDASLINHSGQDQLSIIKGSNACLKGNGAMAAAINMQSTRPTNAAVETEFSIGSFHTRQNKSTLSWTKNKWASKTYFSSSRSKNDFPINIPNLNYSQSQTNAEFDNTHFLQHIYFQPSIHHSIAFHYWYLNADRNIPPTIVQTSSTANQRDKAHRMLVDYEYRQSSINIRLKSAYNSEYNDYKSEMRLPYDSNKFTTYWNEFFLEKKESKQQFLFGLNFQHTNAQTPAYKTSQSFYRWSSIISHRLLQKKWLLQSSIRYEYTSIGWSPFIPGIGIEYYPNHKWTIRANLQRSYRFPTMNDLYWRPGGNVQLKPESAWSQEMTIEYNTTPFSYIINAYHRVTDNWIQWAKTNNDFFFSAYNLDKVKSRGIYQKMTLQWNVGVLKMVADVNHSLTYSTHLSSNASPKYEKGDQIWYVPKNTFGYNLSIALNRFNVNFNQQFYSKTKGINEDLEAYQLINADIHYTFHFQKIKLALLLSGNNIANKNYFTIERRPAPGRYLQCGIKLNLQKHNK